MPVASRAAAAAFACAAAAVAAAPLALLLLLGVGCDVKEPAIPLDKPVFPTGLALVPGAAGDASGHLLVVSSNFDLAFTDSTSSGLEQGQGALLSADLDAVRGSRREVVTGAYTSAVVISGFGDRPVLSPHGDRVFVPLRGSNIVASINVGGNGVVTCGSTSTPEHCGVSPAALQLAQADPFTVLPLSQNTTGNRVTALVTLLSSPVVTFFVDDTSRSGAQRMQITGTIDLGSSIAGIRSAVLRPAVAGTDPVVIANAELSAEASLVGAKVLVFNPSVDTDVVNFDISAATGSLAIRDIALVPGDDGNDDAVIVTLRTPDAIARLEIDDAGSLPTLRLSKLAGVCRQPTNLALWHDDNGRHPDRVLLTCQGGDVVESLDPLTLEPTDAVRFEGRLPFDVVVDQVADQAFVSFFEDDSVGVLSLVDAGGAPTLAFDKRIGHQLPKPEDGRE